MTWRVIVGTLSLVVTMILLGYVAVTEPDRMASFTTSYDTRKIEVGAALFEGSCVSCHGLNGQGAAGPALNTPDLIPALGSSALPPRLVEIGWTGTAENYIRLTIAGGRPRPTVGMEAYSGVRMPTWSDEFGGPFRDDQVEALVAYIMNWGAAFQAGAATTQVAGVGSDISVELPAGDAARGQELTVKNGCTGCHILQAGAATTTGPNWMPAPDNNNQGVGTRAELRLQDAGYAGKAATGDQYLFESIVSPAAFLVPGYQDIMPKHYGTVLDAQMVSDVITYLQTLE